MKSTARLDVSGNRGRDGDGGCSCNPLSRQSFSVTNLRRSVDADQHIINLYRDKTVQITGLLVVTVSTITEAHVELGRAHTGMSR